MTQQIKSLWLEYRTEITIIFASFINLIYITDAFLAGNAINWTAVGQLGDFVGGYIGTVFALISVVLLFATLKNQRRATQEQNFETKYFELIKLHRDNVAELYLQDTSGRRIFVLLVREFRCLLPIVRQIAEKCQQTFTQQQLLHIAYYCLLYGTGPNSSRMLKMSLASFDQAFISMLEEELDKTEVKEKAKADRKFGYKPFEGHQSRLGHYYRHLYQSVCYVDKQTFPLDKYEYVKTIRAQLSTHEQALLLLNSLTPIGQNWWSKELITKYRLVQNLPRDFFNSESELDVAKLFGQGYFEWEDADQS